MTMDSYNFDLFQNCNKTLGMFNVTKYLYRFK